MLCKACGTNNDQGVMFCLNCGAKMENMQSANAVVAAPVPTVTVMPGYMTPEEGAKFVGALKKTATSPWMFSATISTILACICALVTSICLFVLNGSIIYRYYDNSMVSVAKTIMTLIPVGTFIFNLVTVIGLLLAIVHGSPRKPVFKTIGLTTLKCVQIANAAVCLLVPVIAWFFYSISGTGKMSTMSENASMLYFFMSLIVFFALLSLLYVFSFTALSNCKKSASFGEKTKPVSKLVVVGCFGMIFVHLFVASLAVNIYKAVYYEDNLADANMRAQSKLFDSYDYEYGYYYDDYDYYDSYDYEYGYYYDDYDYYDSYDYEYGYYYDDYDYYDSRSYLSERTEAKAYESAYGAFNILVIFSMIQTVFMVLSCVFFGITAWSYNKKIKKIMEEETTAYRIR